MTPSRLRRTIVVERLAWVDRMLVALRALPVDGIGSDADAFD